ncbi:unnamed protein product, partial [Prorocentrum cordatum]
PMSLQSAEQSKSPMYQLRVHGFTEGAHVKRKKPQDDKTEHGTIYMISAMNGSSVVLAPTGRFREFHAITLSQQSLKEGWAPTTTKPQFRISYATCRPDTNPEFVKQHIIGQLIDALAGLSQRSHNSGFMEELDIFSSPNTVTVRADIPKDKLTLVPVTMNIKTRPAKDKCDPKAWDLGTIASDPNTTAYALHPCIVLPKVKEDKPGFTPPYWFAQEAGEGQKGNMKPFLESIPISTPNEKAEVKVPVLRNAVSLKTGDELLMVKQKKKQQGPPVTEPKIN